MIYSDEPWLTIHWDESCQAVRLEWKSYVEGEPAKVGLNAGLELFKTKRTNRWIADVRRLGPIRQVDQQWVSEDWHPRAIAAGVRYMATIIPKSSIARLSIKQLHGKLGNAEFIINNFDDLELARDWLRSQPR